MEKVVGEVRNESNGGKTSHRKTIRTTYSLPRFLTSKKHPSVPQQNRNKDEILFFSDYGAKVNKTESSSAFNRHRQD